MKRYSDAEIINQIFIPLITYLLIGLMVIQLYNLSVNSALFIVWGIMAGVILGIREYFADTIVTAAVGIYAVVIVVWLGLYAGETGKVHAVLAVLGLCAVFLLEILYKNKIIKILSGYVILITLICFEYADVGFSKAIIALAVIIFLNSVSETIAFFYSDNGHSFIIIYVVIAMVTLITPAPREPYDWKFVFNAVNSVNKMIDRIAFEIQYHWGSSEFSGIFHYGYTGYSDASISLSTGLMDSDMVQLIIQGKRTKRNLYLKGNISDSYTGNSWSTENSEETIDYQTDTLMMLYAVFNYTQEQDELSRFMEVCEQEVTMQNIKTKSLFYPLKLLDITAEIIKDGDNLRSDRINTRGYIYSYHFADIDYASQDLINIIKNSEDIIYDEDTYNMIFDKMKEYYDIDLEKIPFQDFIEQVSKGQRAVEVQYTAAGSAVSEDVKKLADAITEGYTNDYDKCKALEKYLYQYHYNKNISVPDNVNILDWFLFEGKEGYCAHYATALVSMLRCEGIPSRLVEGFLIDYKDITSFYNFRISSNTAHVWAEAYIEGFGWIRLEPTVVNAGNANTAWYTDTRTETETESQEETITEAVETSRDGDTENAWLFMIKMLAGMAVIIIVIFAVLLVYRRIHIRKSKDPDVILMHFLSLLGKKCLSIRDGETLREYFNRLSESGQFTEEMQHDLVNILELMEEYWYGSGKIDEYGVKTIKEIRNRFL